MEYFDKPIVSGTIQNPPKTEILTIKAGELFTVGYDYNYIRVTEGNYAAGELEFRFSSTGQPANLVNGQAISLPEVVKNLSIRNSTGEDITLTIFIGIGQIYDDRLSVSGSIAVVNAPSTTLNVEDAATQAAITALRAALESAIENSNSINLNGTTFVDITNSTTTVSSGTNSGGAIIEFCTYGQNSTDICGLKVNNKFITPRNINTNSGNSNGIVRKVIVPSGVSFAFQSPNTSLALSAAYRLL